MCWSNEIETVSATVRAKILVSSKIEEKEMLVGIGERKKAL